MPARVGSVAQPAAEGAREAANVRVHDHSTPEAAGLESAQQLAEARRALVAIDVQLAALGSIEADLRALSSPAEDRTFQVMGVVLEYLPRCPNPDPSLFSAPSAGETPAGEKAVIVTSAGARRIEVIKAVRELTGLGLAEALGVIDSLPQTIKRGLSAAEADAVRAKLVEAGAVAVVQ